MFARQLGVAVADGTAPHVVEPAYPAAVGRYVNLGQFYNVDRLKERRREIVACTDGYQAEYRKAYACLHACGAVRAEMEGSAGAGFDYEKLCRPSQKRLAAGARKKKRRCRTGTAALSGRPDACGTPMVHGQPFCAVRQNIRSAGQLSSDGASAGRTEGHHPCGWI